MPLFFFLMIRRPPRSTLLPSTPLFRSRKAFNNLRRNRLRCATVYDSFNRSLSTSPARRRIGNQRRQARGRSQADLGDRKSTRLNSSHSQISYAVFCLKNKARPTHDSEATPTMPDASFFFFNDTATAEIYPLTLHAPFPISESIQHPEREPPQMCHGLRLIQQKFVHKSREATDRQPAPSGARPKPGGPRRSEEHTSELQSQSNLVCRLLLEKQGTPNSRL